MRLPVLMTLSAAVLALAACDQYGAEGQPPAENTAGKTYGDLPFWEGDVCVEILPGGKRTILPKSKCPPKS